MTKIGPTRRTRCFTSHHESFRCLGLRTPFFEYSVERCEITAGENKYQLIE